jgi:hypothetical protein
MTPPIKNVSGAARPADCAVKVVANDIANVGAIIEREKPKASIAPKDLRRTSSPVMGRAEVLVAGFGTDLASAGIIVDRESVFGCKITS